jgi:ABC-type multidrug transport system ATPase subunit/ABC-type multidrug transport system permease subunit
MEEEEVEVEEIGASDQQRKLERLLTQKFEKGNREDRLVEVRLRHVSYFVPLSSGPGIATVYNQSVFYFMERAVTSLLRILQRPRRGQGESENEPKEATVLHNVNLVLKPGKAYLVLGPSGCGKTSLLEVIAGRLRELTGEGSPFARKPRLSGRVEYNGLALDDIDSVVVQNIATFVCQLDQHAPRLTVRETFDFAYQSRMGGVDLAEPEENLAGTGGSTASENLTIEGLGLAHVADTFVGDSNVRGVSGGQRRRVTVGEMMQGQNPVACADEISTGLDAAITYDIVRSIVRYSKAAKTTRVISLLQPGPETFFLFDEVILLSEGHVVFSGPVHEVEPYFVALGYRRPPLLDLADFLNMLCTPDGQIYYDASISGQETYPSPEVLAAAFAKSSRHERIMRDMDAPYAYAWGKGERGSTGAVGDVETGNSVTERGSPAYIHKKYQNSPVRTIQLNFHRHITLWLRDKGFIIGKAFENLGMAVATGGILFGQARLSSELSQQQLSQTLNGVYSAVFMAAFHIILGTATSVPDDLDRRPIHYKHHDAKFYSVGSFVIGQLLSTLPQRAMEIVIFGTSLYWLAGFSATFSNFITYIMILIFYSFTVRVSFSILVYALPGKGSVQGLATFSVLAATLFCGFMVNRAVVPAYYIWILWCNPMFWAIQGMVSNEFMSSKYDAAIPGFGRLGDLLLEAMDYKVGQQWVGYTFAFFSGFMVLAGCALAAFMGFIRFYPTKAPPVTAAFGDQEVYPEEREQEVEAVAIPFTPVDLTFENVVYEVQASKGEERLRLLNGVSGSLKAGRMCALMGSSGAGKTTLMDVVAQRKVGGTIMGDIRMNGFPQGRTAFLRSSGYVEQFDVQQPELTVYESVVFSARLRLPSTGQQAIDDDAKLRFVRSILDMMELTPIQNQQVGDFATGGLSFEQRKRLAIALELAGSPSIIFLDEPTSGLDARGALLVLRAMRRIADTKRTVCATIHQPSAAVFALFDDLLLLKKGGNVVYFGEMGPESSSVIQYFETRGAQPIPRDQNPAVWVLRESASPTDSGKDWAEVYKSSEEYAALLQELATAQESPDPNREIVFEEEFASTRRQRNWLMIRRTITIYKRSPAYNLGRVMGAAVYALLMGTIFSYASVSGQWSEDEASSLINTMFVALIAMGITCISMAVPVAKRIRDVFYKHRASGMIRSNSVALAFGVGELPYIILISLLFSGLFYASNSLFIRTQNLVKFWGFFTFNAAIYTSFGQAFMCLVKDIPTAGALMGALIGYNVFFSGLIVRPQQFKGPFQLGIWTAPGRFAYEGLIVSLLAENFEDPVLAEPGSLYYQYLGCGVRAGATASTCSSGTMSSYLDYYFGGKFTQSHLLMDGLVLCGYLILALLLTAFALKKFNYVNT